MVPITAFTAARHDGGWQMTDAGSMTEIQNRFIGAGGSASSGDLAQVQLKATQLAGLRAQKKK